MDATRTAILPVARAGVIATGIALLSLAIASIPAAAATVIGSATGNFACGAGIDTVQLSTSGGTSYAVPAGGGAITSWSTQVGAITGQAALLVWRPTATYGTLTLVGESPHVALTANALNTFNLTTPITAQAGDVLGLRVESQSICIQSPGVATGVIGFKAGTTPAVGVTATFSVDPLSLTLDVSATLGTVTPVPPPPPPAPQCHERDSEHGSEHSAPAGHTGARCDDSRKSREGHASEGGRGHSAQD
ncbi:MAG: hypothetical protein ACHQ0J_02340 [Candidatus Dormibacterales bacterium]